MTAKKAKKIGPPVTFEALSAVEVAPALGIESPPAIAGETTIVVGITAPEGHDMAAIERERIAEALRREASTGRRKLGDSAALRQIAAWIEGGCR